MTTETMILLMISAVAIIAIVVLQYNLDKKYSTKNAEKNIDGDLIIDTKDPNKDVFRFELYCSPERLMEDNAKQYVTFKIIRNN